MIRSTHPYQCRSLIGTHDALCSVTGTPPRQDLQLLLAAQLIRWYLSIAIAPVAFFRDTSNIARCLNILQTNSSTCPRSEMAIRGFAEGRHCIVQVCADEFTPLLLRRRRWRSVKQGHDWTQMLAFAFVLMFFVMLFNTQLPPCDLVEISGLHASGSSASSALRTKEAKPLLGQLSKTDATF